MAPGKVLRVSEGRFVKIISVPKTPLLKVRKRVWEGLLSRSITFPRGLRIACRFTRLMVDLTPAGQSGYRFVRLATADTLSTSTKPEERQTALCKNPLTHHADRISVTHNPLGTQQCWMNVYNPVVSGTYKGVIYFSA